MSMEQIKVKKKDVLIVNLIFFLILSFLFLYLQYAYRYHLSPFSLAYFKKSIELFWYALAPIFLTSLLAWKHNPWSKIWFSFCVSIVSYKVVEGLFIEFNKIIVVALFFYIVIAYFIYQLYSYYLSLANLNPNYSSKDLFDPLLKKIFCEISNSDEVLKGHLTNWDEEGCFIILEKPLSDKARNLKLTIHFKGRSFEQDGEVVAQSTDFLGVGIKFNKVPKGLNVFNYAEFTELVHELGFKPERLR
jgi:hypothetical protein